MKFNVLVPCFMGIVLCTSCYYDGHGLVGAQFRLGEDSRLPSWFKNPKNLARKNLNVEIRRYESDKIRVIISTSDWFGRTLLIGTGKYRWHPDSAKQEQPAGTFPNWVIFTINGTEEVYEQRGMNDLLWIVDKPIPK